MTEKSPVDEARSAWWNDGNDFGPKFTAVQNPSNRRMLRRMMKAAGSDGCPAACKTSVIDIHVAEDDVKSAIAQASMQGLLEEVRDRRLEGTGRVRYNKNDPGTIGMILQLLGDHLRLAQKEHGIPYAMSIDEGKSTSYILCYDKTPDAGGRFYQEMPFPDEAN